MESDSASITDSFGTQRAREAIRTRLEIRKGDGLIFLIQSDPVGGSAYLLLEVFVKQGLGVMLIHQPVPLRKGVSVVRRGVVCRFFHYMVVRQEVGAGPRPRTGPSPEGCLTPPRVNMSRMSDPYLERVPHELSTDVELWRVDLDAYAEGVALDGLCAHEYARAARMALGRDAQRYLASRHALRHVLATALDRSPESLVIEPDDFGKPHLAGESALHFNLSHSAHECLIGVSEDRPIGVDIEVVHKVVDADTLARAYFTDDERAE